MASGDRIRQSAIRARMLTQQKKQRIGELRRRIEDMRGELDRLMSAANDWDREMTSMNNDLSELEKLAQSFDELERTRGINRLM